MKISSAIISLRSPLSAKRKKRHLRNEVSLFMSCRF